LKVQEGSRRVRHQRLSSPPPPPRLRKKFSPDLYVSYGPHWAAQGGSDPWTLLASYAAASLTSVSNENTKFSGHPMVDRADNFENGYREVRPCAGGDLKSLIF